MEKYNFNGYSLNVIRTKKFKSSTIVVRLVAPLSRATVTTRKLLSMLLIEGTSKHQGLQELVRYAEELYGLNVSITTGYRGSDHFISLYSTAVNQEFLPVEFNLLERQIELLNDILNDSFLKMESFDDDKIRIAKTNLANQIKSQRDDKIVYSMNKLYEVMGGDKPLAISPTGYLEDIESITKQDLLDCLDDIIANDQKFVFACGDYDEDVTKTFEKTLVFTPNSSNYEAVEPFVSPRIKVLEEVEIQQLAQAKVNLGFTCDIDVYDSRNYAMKLFNFILGGYSQSRLFQVVREKHSLCYYIGSAYDSYNCVLTVYAGVDNDKTIKAKELMIQQIEEIQHGNLLDEHIDLAKTYFKSQFSKGNDEAHTLINRQFNKVLVNQDYTNEEYLEKILAVTKQEIIEVANTINLDTIFILRGNTGDG